MKKKVSVLLITIFMLSGCSSLNSRFGKQYVLEPYHYANAFNLTIPQVLEGEELSWMNGNYVSKRIDSEDNLILVLTAQQAELWRECCVDILKSGIDIIEGMGHQVIINDEYTAIQYYGEAEYSIAAVITSIDISIICELIQMFSGISSHKISVYLTIYSIINGNLLWEGEITDDISIRIPEDIPYEAWGNFEDVTV